MALGWIPARLLRVVCGRGVGDEGKQRAERCRRGDMQYGKFKTRIGWLVVTAAAVLISSAPAAAQKLVFDFDIDDDPGTIRNVITAEVGTLVEAYLVVQGFPVPYTFLGGLQFGLQFSDGLAFAGVRGVDDRVGFLMDGPEGFAVAFGRNIARDELPMFSLAFVFRVTGPGEQEVRVTPSTGWNTTYEGVLYSVGNDPDNPATTLIEDPHALATQVSGIVNRDPVPIIESSWGAIKKLFSDDAL
jgi:hypothetical protein